MHGATRLAEPALPEVRLIHSAFDENRVYFILA
jgi:hypothetical protein